MKNSEADVMETCVTEEFLSGFCKLQNQTRMVLCEVETLENGKKQVLSSDCAYGVCEHSCNCLLMGQFLNADGQ